MNTKQRPEGTSIDLSGRLALRPAEAARALGVSERTLRSMLPELPHAHIGAAVVLPVDELKAWLREQMRREQAETDGAAREIADALTKS